MKTKTILEVTTLRCGDRIVRPDGVCGTCGWHPKAWQAAYVQPGETPEGAFLRANTNWTREELK